MVGGPSEPRRAESDCRSGRPGQPGAGSCRGGGDLPRNAGYCSGFSLCCDSRCRNCASGVVAEATEGEDRLIRPVPLGLIGRRVHSPPFSRRGGCAVNKKTPFLSGADRVVSNFEQKMEPYADIYMEAT